MHDPIDNPRPGDILRWPTYVGFLVSEATVLARVDELVAYRNSGEGEIRWITINDWRNGMKK